MDTRKKVASSTTNPLNDRNKDTNKNLQIKLLAEYFSEKPKTMYQAEQETGVKIANISISHTGKSDSMRVTENTLRTISNCHYLTFYGKE